VLWVVALVSVVPVASVVPEPSVSAVLELVVDAGVVDDGSPESVGSVVAVVSESSPLLASVIVVVGF